MMKGKKYEVTTHYAMGGDSVCVCNSCDMLDFVTSLQERDDIVGLTIFEI